jgi:hypothetical protein
VSNNNDGWFFEEWPEEPTVWDQLFDVIQSDSAYEQFTSAIGLGELLEKPEGEPIQSDRPMESYTVVVKNRSFARKVPFTYETMQDAKKASNLLQTTVGSWSRGLVLTKEKFYVKFFTYGAFAAGRDDPFDNTITGVISDASGDKIYDSAPFFGTHTDRVGNSYSNHASSNALSHTTLKSTWLTYTHTNAKDERGEPVSITPDVILHPNALRWTVQEILNTTLIPYSMDNTTNVISSIVVPMEWRFLADTDAWFLGKKKQGLMATERENVSMDFWQDEETMDYYARVFTRFGGAVTQWRYWYASNCLTS